MSALTLGAISTHVDLLFECIYIPMAAVFDRTPGCWLAVAPVYNVNLLRFLIYDFQMDGVCGLSPTLVQI